MGRTSITYIVRSLRPLGVSAPFAVSEKRGKWRRCEASGLQPQNTTRSARSRTSPSVQVGSPTACIASPVGP